MTDQKSSTQSSFSSLHCSCSPSFGELILQAAGSNSSHICPSSPFHPLAPRAPGSGDPQPSMALCFGGSLCPLQTEVKGGDDFSTLSQQGPLASPASPHRKLEPEWMWSSRATVYTAKVSPTPFTPWWVWRKGQLSSQPPCSLGPPPTKPGTHGPPTNPSAFQRKSAPYVLIHLHFNSPWGGREQAALPSSPPPPQGGWGACAPSGTGS